MNRMLDVVVYEADCLAGETLINLLDERLFPLGSLYFIADNPEPDAAVSFRGEEIDVLKADGFEFVDVDVLFLPAGCGASDELVAMAAEANCLVMDGRLNSTAGPMVLPGINEDLQDEAREGRVAVIPSSAAALMLPVLKPLQDELGIDSISVTVCQSVSGLGSTAITDLRKQTVELLNGQPVSGGRMAFNVLPQVGEFGENGFSSEEQAIVDELIRGLGNDDVRVNPTCVRVPVFFGDSLSIQLELDKPIEVDMVRELLSGVDGVELTSMDDYPTVESVAGIDQIVVGRVRHQAAFSGQLALCW